MTQRYISLKEALSELRIEAALKRLARLHAPAVQKFLSETCLGFGAEISFFTVVHANEFVGSKLKTYNRYRDDVSQNIKPDFQTVKRPEYLTDEYDPNDHFNANFRFYIPEGGSELQLTVRDVAAALTESNSSISTIYLNEFGNVFYELERPLIRAADDIKFERSKLIHWARSIYLYMEEKIPEGIGSNASLAEVEQWFVKRMKSSDAIIDPVLAMYVKNMLGCGRLPLMHELKDTFACLYAGKRSSEWPTLTLAPPCDVDDVTQSSNFLNLAKAKERIKVIFLPNILCDLTI